MPVLFGTQNPDALKVGDNNVQKIYLGLTDIFNGDPVIPGYDFVAIASAGSHEFAYPTNGAPGSNPGMVDDGSAVHVLSSGAPTYRLQVTKMLLPTPFEVSSATDNGTVQPNGIASVDTLTSYPFFTPDGLGVLTCTYTLPVDGTVLLRFDGSVPWSFDTSFRVVQTETVNLPSGQSNGRMVGCCPVLRHLLYANGQAPWSLRRYELTTPGTLSSAEERESVDLQSLIPVPDRYGTSPSFCINSSGSVLLAASRASGGGSQLIRLFKFYLPVPWNLGSAVYATRYDLGNFAGDFAGMTLSESANKLTVVEGTRFRSFDLTPVA